MSYSNIKFYDGSLSIVGFAIFGVGDLRSAIIYPSHLSNYQVITDNDLRSNMLFIGKARFLYKRNRDKSVGNVEASTVVDKAGRLQILPCSVEQKNNVHYLLTKLWQGSFLI